MQNFVDEFYSVDKFWKAYSKRVVPIDDCSFWPHVDFATEVCAPIGKRVVGRQRKIVSRVALKGKWKKSSVIDNEKKQENAQS